MATLNGLKGTYIKEMEFEIFRKPSEISKILKKNKAAVAADDNGAINIWNDDEGFIRCESMRFCISLDVQKFSKIGDAKSWAEKWLIEIQ